MKILIAAAFALTLPLSAFAQTLPPTVISTFTTENSVAVDDFIQSEQAGRGNSAELPQPTRKFYRGGFVVGGLVIGGNPDSKRRRNKFDSGRFDSFGFRQNIFD